MELNLEDYRVGDPTISTIYYIPNYINEYEEEALLKNVEESPKPKWTYLKNRRLQNWGGIPTEKGLITEEIPPWLGKYTEGVGSLGLFEGKTPNHVLINEYLPGQGIMPHLDGPIFYPTITTINLGSSTMLNFYRPLDDESGSNDHNTEDSMMNGNPLNSWANRLQFSLFLQPRSLLILKDKFYSNYLHGIEEKSEDKISHLVLNASNCQLKVGDVIPRETRVSLTIRYVPKTSKLNLGLLMRK